LVQGIAPASAAAGFAGSYTTALRKLNVRAGRRDAATTLETPFCAKRLPGRDRMSRPERARG